MDGLCVFSSFLAIFILPCQVFGFQKTQKACNSPLGIQNGQVPDSHLSASSYYNIFIGSEHVDMKAKYCRLNHKYAWCTNRSRRNKASWLMVDLGRITNVTAISTQGYAGVNDYYVKSFKLAYSNNGSSWKFVGKDGIATVFVGNKHGLDTKKNNFDEIQARYIKVFPITYYIRICLRIELYGCVQGSSIPTTTSPTTTTLISTSKTSSSTKTPTTITHTPTPSAITTSITRKATSIKSTTIASVIPSTSSTSTTIATSSDTTGIPSYQHTTTVPSSQSVPTTSSNPSEEPSTVAMTISKGATSIATLIKALHRKSTNDKDEEKKYIYAGIGIGVLLLFVVLLLTPFLFCRRRKRTFNVSCQLVDMPQYPYDSQVDLVESIGHHTFVALENESTTIES